jgi:hypothetical protein
MDSIGGGKAISSDSGLDNVITSELSFEVAAPPPGGLCACSTSHPGIGREAGTGKNSTFFLLIDGIK